jgi:myo-inositol-1(or 4)-monophosphatase
MPKHPLSAGIVGLPLSAHDLETAERLAACVREAGAIAMRYFKPGDQTEAAVNWKGDGSPVTEADYAVNVFLERNLRALWPAAAWLSEESVDDASRLGAERVIIVDPIDGTRGFARGDRHWCIAAALVENGRPIIAIVHAPASGETYTACEGHGALLNGEPLKLAAPQALWPDMKVSSTASMAQALRTAGVSLEYLPKISSLALRIANVAAGTYDCCLTAKYANDWDLAAADLILAEAGGLLAGYDGNMLVYNRADTRHGALTATPASLQRTLVDAIARAEKLSPHP